MTIKPELIRRQQATQQTIGRYRRKSFDWAKGVTCAHMLRQHLRNMGHKPGKVPPFRSAVGAKKALASLGFDSMTAMLDSLLTPIAPAQMVLGDIAVVPGEAGMDAVMICAGPRRVFGWFEDYDKPVMVEPDMDLISGAWRA